MILYVHARFRLVPEPPHRGRGRRHRRIIIVMSALKPGACNSVPREQTVRACLSQGPCIPAAVDGEAVVPIDLVMRDIGSKAIR